MSKLAQQANSDEQLIKMWLHSKAATTQEAYAREAQTFLNHINKPLHQATISDVQDYLDSMEGKAPATVSRSLNALKSLFRFGQRIGYFQFNVAAAEKAPRVKNTTAERILSRDEVLKMIDCEECDRNKALLTLLYAGGLRVSELCSLKWRDLRSRNSNGQVTIFGKGGKTRTVLIPGSAWERIMTLHSLDCQLDDPVFKSQRGGHFDPSAVWRIVKAAAQKAGITDEVSPHWLRHCMASHSLEAGAPLHLVQASLGHASATTTSRYLHARPDDSAGMYLGM